MTGEAYGTSAETAAELSPFPGYAKNREHMLLRVIRNHLLGRRTRCLMWNMKVSPITPAGTALSIVLPTCPRCQWTHALELGTAYGYRNAQVTVIAPTGTIGLVMDCDTTGRPADFAPAKFKKLAGGGYFKIINQSLPVALAYLWLYGPTNTGYRPLLCRCPDVWPAPFINHDTLRQRDSAHAALGHLENNLGQAFENRLQ